MKNNVYDTYVNFLSTPAPDFHGRVCLPIASATLNSMIENHKSLNQSELASMLIKNTLMSGKKIKFWSDPHFYHNNIIKYCDRPFKSTIHMNMMMVDYYNKEVSKDDLVIWGGDISFGNKDDTRALLKDLPGKKILIMGNHDFLKKKKFIDFGIFDATVICLNYQEKIDDEQWDIWVTHYPIDDALIPAKTINVHGHIHSYTAGVKNLNISVEHTDYRPQDITTNLKSVKDLIVSGVTPVKSDNMNQKIRMDI